MLLPENIECLGPDQEVKDPYSSLQLGHFKPILSHWQEMRLPQTFAFQTKEQLELAKTYKLKHSVHLHWD